MDETRQDAARAAARRPWRADSPQAGRPGGSRWGARPELRVSDAERDAVVTELGEHFGQGRLDQSEFDERAILIAGVAAGGWHHGWVPWPLFWLLPVMVLRFGWWRRSWRGRQWQ